MHEAAGAPPPLTNGACAAAQSTRAVALRGILQARSLASQLHRERAIVDRSTDMSGGAALRSTTPPPSACPPPGRGDLGWAVDALGVGGTSRSWERRRGRSRRRDIRSGYSAAVSPSGVESRMSKPPSQRQPSHTLARCRLPCGAECRVTSWTCALGRRAKDH